MSAMVVDELITLLGFRVDKAELAGVNKMMGEVESKMKDLAFSAAGTLTALFGVGKAVEMVMGSIKGAAALESMNAEFEVMLGNAEAAKYLVQEINQLAADTPFETKGLVNGVRMMMAFGQSAKDAFNAVKLLGDVAGSDQNKLDQLTLAYSQVFAAGKLQGNDLLQFVNAGFNPLKQLSEMTGKSMGTLREEMAKGLITAEMVKKAFEAATGPGGRFFGNMEKQSKTLNGLWSTLHDNFYMTMVAFGDSMLPYIKAVITALIPMVDGIAEAYNQVSLFFGVFFDEGPNAVETATGIATAFMTIADVIMSMGMAVQVVRTVFDSLLTVIMGLVTAAVTIVTLPLVAFVKTVGIIEASIASLLRKLHIFSGVSKFLTGESQTAESAGNTLAAPAEYMGRVTGEFAGQAGKDWEKSLDLSSMIGGSAKSPNPKIKLTDDILAKLSGSSKVVNNNIHNEVTIHAEGGFKDLLKEGANSVFSLTFGETFATRLVAATA